MSAFRVGIRLMLIKQILFSTDAISQRPCLLFAIFPESPILKLNTYNFPGGHTLSNTSIFQIFDRYSAMMLDAFNPNPELWGNLMQCAFYLWTN